MESVQSTKNHATVFQSVTQEPPTFSFLWVLILKRCLLGLKIRSGTWKLYFFTSNHWALGCPPVESCATAECQYLGQVCSSVKARLWRGYCPRYTSFPSGSHGGNRKHKCHISKCFYPVVYQSPYFFPPAFKSEQSNFKNYSSQLKCIAAFQLLSEDM